jgi:hypothetical protein
MKRKLVKENLSTRTNSLRKSFREGDGSEAGLKALKDVQTSFDSLIKQMTTAKVLLAELSTGADEGQVEFSSSSEWEEGEAE